eukprot:1270896-Rhodomonas_salina.1
MMFTNVGVVVDEAGNADYSLLEYNQAVVALELLCGKRFGAININTERGVFNAIDVLKMDLASFGIQIKNAAQMHHSECFVGNGQLVTNHGINRLVDPVLYNW